MTEIKIEKKKPIWPWILAAAILIIAAILFFLFNSNDPDRTDTMPQDTTRVEDNVKNDNKAVAAYIAFAASDTGTMGLDHDYTHTALLKLADATQAMADRTGYEVKADLDKARAYAEKITHDPMATTHADNIKNATGILGNALQNIQKASYPQLSAEAETVRADSKAIGAGELTLDQKKAVKSFFNDAAILLKKMN